MVGICIACSGVAGKCILPGLTSLVHNPLPIPWLGIGGLPVLPVADALRRPAWLHAAHIPLCHCLIALLSNIVVGQRVHQVQQTWLNNSDITALRSRKQSLTLDFFNVPTQLQSQVETDIRSQQLPLTPYGTPLQEERLSRRRQPLMYIP